MSIRRPIVPLIAVASLVAYTPAARAQALRVSGVTTVQYVGIRPLIADSVAVGETDGSGLLRLTPEGYVARCVEGDPICRFNRSGDATSTMPALQDLRASLWGLGRGVRAYAHLRGRNVLAGRDSVWPRGDDAMDVLVAYVEIDRPRFRLRAGRQWKTSGLGYYNYDGGSAFVRLGRRWSAEAFGGRSLARGLNEPRTGEALAAVETYVPNDDALLVGGQVTARPFAGAFFTALYQREIRNDRYGLYAERVSFDGAVRRGRGSVEGTLEVDAASRVVNDARLRVRYALTPSLGLSAYARQYEPFFELWTIWGAFDPVGFHEVGVAGTWRADRRPLEVRATLSRRGYPGTHTSPTYGAARSTGWLLGASGSARLAGVWALQARYRADVGFGAAKSETAVRVQRDLRAGTYAGLSFLAFQRLFEFRVDEGTVLGVSADGSARLGPRARVSGSVSVYRHHETGSLPTPDWGQVRGMLRVEWTVGPEPGVPTPKGGTP